MEASAAPPTPEAIFAKARAAAVARIAHLPPYIAFRMDAEFVRKGKTRAYHYRYVLRTSDGKEFEQQLPDSPRDRIDERPVVTARAQVFSPLTAFDLRPRRPGERPTAFEVQSSPSPEPSAAAAEPAVIGRVIAVSRPYALRYVGEEQLDDAPVWHLHAEPRYDAPHHPIRELYVRESDGEPLRIVVVAAASLGPVRSNPSVVFDYRQFGETWLVSHVAADVELRMALFTFGGALAARISEVTFPPDEPAWMFDQQLLDEHQREAARK